MSVAYAGPEDIDYLEEKDHIGREMIGQKVARREFALAYQGDRRVGFLRYNFFWDDMPFMNLLWVEEGSRGEGFGTRLVSFWEEEMHELGYGSVMTSTLSTNGGAQRLYRRLGYDDVGCLLIPDDPLEIVFLKTLSAEA